MDLALLRGHDQQKPLLGATIDWAHPLAYGLTDLWLLNEGSGPPFSCTRPTDGAALSATAPVWTPSQGGAALKFAANNTYVNTNVTISGAYNTSSGSVVWRLDPLFAFNDSAVHYFWGAYDGTNEFCGLKDNANNWRCGWAGGGNARIGPAASATNCIQNTWQTYAFTWTPSATLFYRNGVQLASGGGVTSPVNTASFYIGNENGNATVNQANALIDYLGIWSRALSAAEILDLAAQPYALVRPAAARRLVPFVPADPFPLAHNSVALLQSNASYRM